MPPEKLYEAFGETKTMKEWLNDPRCVVREKSTIRMRIERGASFEVAMTTPLRQDKLYAAFGELKTLREWGQDPRCTILYSSLVYRVKQGHDMEAILTGQVAGVRNRDVTMEAFGERKKISEWVKDPRCFVPLGILQMRLKWGKSLEEAMSRLKVRGILR